MTETARCAYWWRCGRTAKYAYTDSYDGMTNYVCATCLESDLRDGIEYADLVDLSPETLDSDESPCKDGCSEFTTNPLNPFILICKHCEETIDGVHQRPLFA